MLSALAMRRIGSRSLLRRIRVFRVSSEQPSIFVANLVAGLAAADQDDPDVIAAKKVGGLLVERTKEGRSARRWCGTVEVRLDMLAGGEHSRQLIGYVTLIGATLFVYLLSSAAAANLRDASAAEDCGNGAVETIREAIRVLTTIQREHEPGFRLELHYTDETRAARSRPQATKLLTTATRYQVRLFLRGQEWNPSRTTDAQVIDMLLGMAAVERDLSVQRMLRGKVSLLIIHRLPEPLRSNVPFTHEAYRYRRTDEHGRAVAEVDEHRPAPKENAGAILKSLVRAVLTAGREAEAAGRKTVDWNELACTLAKAHDLRERSPEAVASGAPGLISELRGDGPGLALRRLLGRRYRQAWRAGRLPGPPSSQRTSATWPTKQERLPTTSTASRPSTPGWSVPSQPDSTSPTPSGTSSTRCSPPDRRTPASQPRTGPPH
ncbi:MAG: hypothetical protein ACRDZ7_07505 [Acidimicrobiia bacterium]